MTDTPGSDDTPKARSAPLRGRQGAPQGTGAPPAGQRTAARTGASATAPGAGRGGAGAVPHRDPAAARAAVRQARREAAAAAARRDGGTPAGGTPPGGTPPGGMPSDAVVPPGPLGGRGGPDGADIAAVPPAAAVAAAAAAAAAPPAPTDPVAALQRLADTAAIRAVRVRLAHLPRLRGCLPRPRLRLLPAMIFVAVVMLGVRLGDVWTGIVAGTPLPAVAPSLAQEEGPAAAPATADAPAAPLPVADTQVATVADPAATPASGTAPPRLVEDGDMSDGELAVLRSLADRRQSLDTRERELDRRAALLAVAEQRLDEKMVELTALRSQLEGMMAQLDEEQEAHLLSLVRIYETMRPSDAAAIFNGLDMEVLISVLQRMREQKSAPILAAMEPERARQVTSELALRRPLPALPE